MAQQPTTSANRNRFFGRRHRLWLIIVLVLALAGMGLAGPLARLLTRPEAPSGPTPLERRGEGFGQVGERVGYAFRVRNADTAQAVQNAEYRVTVYDAAGAPLRSDAGPIVLVLPGQTLGIGGSLTVAAGARATRLGVELQGGTRAGVVDSAPLSVDGVHYRTETGGMTASGVVHNPFERYISDLRVSAVAFDAAGHIIGGGAGYLDFVPAGGALGAITALDAAGAVARVEMYAAFSEKSAVTVPGESVALGAQPPALAAQGFGQAGSQLGYGLQLANPNPGYAVQTSRYYVTAYGADDSVLATDAGRVELLPPGETAGVAGVIELDSAAPVVRIEAWLLPGKVLVSGKLPPFVCADLAYHSDGQVTGQVINPYSQRVTAVRVSAIAYDAAGAIIGGGYTTLDEMAPNGRVAVEVPLVAGPSPPARVELYAARTALTKME